jgi:hypothetical protein
MNPKVERLAWHIILIMVILVLIDWAVWAFVVVPLPSWTQILLVFALPAFLLFLALFIILKAKRRHESDHK